MKVRFKKKSYRSWSVTRAIFVRGSHLLYPLTVRCRWGTTDDFTTSFLHFSLFSIALWDLANSRPVHSLMLSSHLFLCLPCLLPPFTVPCKMVLARPDEQETSSFTLFLCWPWAVGAGAPLVQPKTGIPPDHRWTVKRTIGATSRQMKYGCEVLCRNSEKCSVETVK